LVVNPTAALAYAQRLDGRLAAAGSARFFKL
jgi:hypothetical protein